MSGWLTALKGLGLMSFPGTFSTLADNALDAGNWWVVTWIVVFMPVGLYLTWVGWAPTPHRPARHEAGAAPDLSRAA